MSIPDDLLTVSPIAIDIGITEREVRARVRRIWPGRKKPYRFTPEEALKIATDTRSFPSDKNVNHARSNGRREGPDFWSPVVEGTGISNTIRMRKLSNGKPTYQCCVGPRSKNKGGFFEARSSFDDARKLLEEEVWNRLVQSGRVNGNVSVAIPSAELKGAVVGWVYFIGVPDTGQDPYHVKIGWSKNPDQRAKTLSATYPEELHVVHQVPGRGKPLEEKDVQDRFVKYRERPDREWFDIPRKYVVMARRYDSVEGILNAAVRRGFLDG